MRIQNIFVAIFAGAFSLIVGLGSVSPAMVKEKQRRGENEGRDVSNMTAKLIECASRFSHLTTIGLFGTMRRYNFTLAMQVGQYRRELGG